MFQSFLRYSWCRLYTLTECTWRVSRALVAREETGWVRLYTLAESSQFWRAIRGDSQVRNETLWLVHHGQLKKRDFKEARHKRRSYTRGSKARRVFPSTFSFSPFLGFPRRECTAGIMFQDNFGQIIIEASSIFSSIFFQNHLKYFPKFSQVFLEIWNWNDYRNFPICFSEFSKIFLKILWNISQNFMKYFSKFYEIFLKILWNTSLNSP